VKIPRVTTKTTIQSNLLKLLINKKDGILKKCLNSPQEGGKSNGEVRN
jgi:hypothetical protein